jgi:hypothetical protein
MMIKQLMSLTRKIIVLQNGRMVQRMVKPLQANMGKEVKIIN